jgi:hypothetical protein
MFEGNPEKVRKKAIRPPFHKASCDCGRNLLLEMGTVHNVVGVTKKRYMFMLEDTEAKDVGKGTQPSKAQTIFLISLALDLQNGSKIVNRDWFPFLLQLPPWLSLAFQFWSVIGWLFSI